MSILCDDGQFTNNIIEEFGEQITLRTEESVTYTDEYDTKTEVNKLYSLKGMMNVYNSDSDGVREGTYFTGQITFLIPVNWNPIVKPEQFIYYPPDGFWYEIQRITKNSVAGVVYSLEITVRRLGTPIEESTIQNTIDSLAVIT